MNRTIGTIISAWIVIGLLAGLLPPAVDGAIYHQYTLDPDISGYIQTSGGVETVFTNSTTINVSAAATSSYGFLTFNTTALGSDVRVVSATLFMYYYYRDVSPWPEAPISIWQENYGPTLTVDDSPPAFASGYQDDPLCYDSELYGWKDAILNTSSVNLTGPTQYILETSSTAKNCFYGPAADKHPYLLIDAIYDDEVIITYNFTAAGMTNRTLNIYPVEIIEYGSQQLYRYEFYSTNQTHNNLTMPNDDFIYRSINPYADVTQLDAVNYTITDLTPNTMYWIWFTLNVTANCQAYITMYREATGQGVPFESWQLYINEGDYTNTTGQELLPMAEINLEIGTTYTISVYDWFDTPNFITNYTFIPSDFIMPVRVPVPYGPINFKSWRNDTTNVRVFFEGNTSNPYQLHVPGGEWYMLDVRGGDWMIALDYLETVGNTTTVTSTTFLNLTVNSSLAYTLNIGTDSIGILSTTVNGITVSVANIEIGLMPSIEYIYHLVPQIPLGDGTRSTLSPVELAYIATYPYKITEADIVENYTGTNTTFEIRRPTNGTVAWNSDVLYTVSGNAYASLYVNYTNGTNIVNYTEYPIYLDLTDYDLDNYTVWSNSSCRWQRVGNFRQVQRMYWSYITESERFTTSQAIENPSGTQWRNVFWFIGYSTDGAGGILQADTSAVLVYDLDNMEFLEMGKEFDATNSGIQMLFSYLNDTDERSMTFTYWLSNASDLPTTTPVINIRSYTIESRNGENYYSGIGKWTNTMTGDYRGDVSISLKSLLGNVDPASVAIFDEIGNSNVNDEYFTVAGSTITISSEIVGTVEPGEVVEYRVYFLYENVEPPEFLLFQAVARVGWVEINAHLFLFMAAIGVGGYGTVEMISARKRQEEARGFGYVLLGSFLFLGYIALWLWHQMGVL